MGAIDRFLKRGRSSDFRPNDIARGLAELRKFGADAHLYLPGPGIPILGPELVVNGDFSSGTTGWSSFNAAHSVVGGELVSVTTAIGGGSWQDLVLSAGKTYQVAGSGRKTTATTAMIVVQRGFAGSYAYLNQTLLGASTTLFSFQIQPTGADVQIKLTSSTDADTLAMDNISVREIIGYSNKISGITAGNYLDSIGTTHASVDGLVGLVLDGAGTVGSDLSPAGALNLQSAAWFKTGGCNPTSATTLTFSGPNEELAQDGLGENCAGKTYKCTLRASGNGVVYFGVTNKIDFAAREPVSLSADVTTTTIYVKQNSTPTISSGISIVSASATEISIEAINWQEVTGIHATQATTGNKPTLRRGLVNLLKWSNDLTNAEWVVSGSASKVDSSHINFTASTSDKVTQATANGVSSVGDIWTQAVMLSGSGQVSLFIYDNGGAFPGTSSSQITLTATPTMYVVSRTHTDVTATSIACQIVNSSGTAATVTVGGSALLQGTYTADQIIAAGGIPLTTTAPASSNVGAYYWETASQDHLSLGSPLFGIEDDHFVVAGGERTNAPGNQGLFCPAASAIFGRIASIQYDGSGPLTAVYLDDAVANSRVIVGNPIPADTPFIASILAVGGVAKLRKNGNEEGTPVNLAGLGTTTPNAAFIGKGATGGDYWQGKIYPALAIKGTVSDAQLLIFERMINALSGYAAGRF